jgi:electron transfer flavoprotein alpha subunit
VKILCLVKQVPHPSAIEFDQETKSLRREGVPLLLNPFDAYALTHAVRLRERLGGEVVAMTMGPPAAEEALRECLARGADRCVHLSDRLFAVADTLGTSRTLALALAREEPDLVLCGRKTLDAETWQVPPEVAAFLGWPHLTSVVALDGSGDARLRLTRENDAGFETYEAAAPLVVAVAAPTAPLEDVEPAAADGRIELWTARDLVGEVHEPDRRFGQTGSPTRVLAVRDVRPPRAGALASGAEEAARLVRERLDALEPPATAWEKPDRLGEQPGQSYDCWSVVELAGGRPSRLSLELLGKGRELSGKLGGRNVALVLGHGLEAATREAIRHGADAVYVLDDPLLRDYEPEVWSAALRGVLERHRPHALLIPATANGRDYGPRAAGELELGMTGDCIGLGIDRAGRLIQTKPAYGGAIVSVIMGATTPQLATVRARSFEPLEPRDDATAEVFRIALEDVPEERLRVVERRDDSPAYELDEADVIVCVGAEVGGPEAVRELEALARRLGAALGGDRAAAEAGLVPRNRQIGLYGRSVAPRLYLAVGVDGDYEHLAGPMRAGVIAAVNRDPRAPMLAAADVGLAGDWRGLLPPLVEGLAAA